MMTTQISRRHFVASTAQVAGSVFVLGFSVSSAQAAQAPSETEGGTINAFIAIRADGKVVFQNPYVEMGQGITTALPMLISEELDVPLADFVLEHAPPGNAYKLLLGNRIRFTGASSSVRSAYLPLRTAAATAREMLLQAAATQWGAPRSELTTQSGKVMHSKSGRQATYAELASAASKLTPPSNVALKDPQSFKIIGTPVLRHDSADKSSGKATFGIDVNVDGMLYAAVKACPTHGGSVVSFNAAPILAMPGVVAVEAVKGGQVYAVDTRTSAVAVIADSWWRAKRAVEALEVTWDAGPSAGFSSVQYRSELKAAARGQGLVAEALGDVQSAQRAPGRRKVATFDSPYLSQAPLEPMNCTAFVQADRAELWAPNQGVDFVIAMTAKITGLAPDKIKVNTPYLGGGFGRRFILDYVAHAVQLSKAVGRPVKVIWSREEDLQHGHYRPMNAVTAEAVLGEDGYPSYLSFVAAGDGAAKQKFAGLMRGDLDPTVTEGLVDLPYAIPAKQVQYVYKRSEAPVSFWRSVGFSQNGFFVESFIDELAHDAGRDPLKYRLHLLRNAPRHAKVLKTAAAAAGWNPKKYVKKDGSIRAMGLALVESWGSIAAQVAEVSFSKDGIKVHNVWCAVDCGSVVNPAIVKAQMESGITQGLSAALSEAVTFKNGVVQESNFDNYRILAPQDMPKVSVEIVTSDGAMGGIGEVGVPPIAPAVANALYVLTGKRARTMPLRPVYST